MKVCPYCYNPIAHAPKAYIIELMDELDDIGESYVPGKVFLSKESAQKEVDEWSADEEVKRWGYVYECEVVE